MLGFTVALAKSRLPFRTSFGAGAVGMRWMAISSATTFSIVPGLSPALSRMIAGMTTRSALSMVVFMP